MAEQTLPVSILTMVIKENGTSIYYPQVVGLMNTDIQQSINEMIYGNVLELIQEQQDKQGTADFEEMFGTFEIKTNERHILSLTLTNYAIAFQHANGLTRMKGMTFDTNAGIFYTLGDMFKESSHFIDVLSDIVGEQLDERDIPLIDDFRQIDADQDFYVADKVLVLFFQALEYTPHYIGLPMFPISIYTLDAIVDEDGPLGILAAD